MSALKKELILLGSTHPELRSDIRPVLASLEKTAGQAPFSDFMKTILEEAGAGVESADITRLMSRNNKVPRLSKEIIADADNGELLVMVSRAGDHFYSAVFKIEDLKWDGRGSNFEVTANMTSTLYLSGSSPEKKTSFKGSKFKVRSGRQLAVAIYSAIEGDMDWYKQIFQ